MKNIIAMVLAVSSLAACDIKTSDRTNTTEVTTTSTSDNAAYAPAEGDVSRRNGKVVVWRNGQWVEADEDVRLNDGTVVNRNGRVTRDGDEIELREGEVVNKTGAFFDKTGKAIENAWDATKEGVKKAGQEVKDAVDVKINTK